MEPVLGHSGLRAPALPDRKEEKAEMDLAAQVETPSPQEGTQRLSLAAVAASCRAPQGVKGGALSTGSGIEASGRGFIGFAL